MPRSPDKAHARHRALKEMLLRGEAISTAELAGRFGVETLTIRRDLQALEASGLAVRRYGGAIAAQRISFEFAFDERRQRNLEEKQRIGAAAAKRISGGQVVFLDTGTTTLHVARSLRRNQCRCILLTSSLVCASELWGSPLIELMLLGGRVRQGSPDLVGAGTEIMLDQWTADIALIGSDGIDPRRGFFASSPEAAGVAHRMVLNARRVIVVADHTKLGMASVSRYAEVTQVHELITDRQALRAAVAGLRRAGVRVTLV